jgi:Tfp pilus assembly protein PilO
MNNLDYKQKNLIYIGASIAIIAAVFFLVIRPTIAYINETNEQIYAERERLEKQYQRIMYLKNNYRKLQEIEEQLDVLDDLFLIQNQELEFITTLEDIANKTGVDQDIKLQEVNLNDPKQNLLPFTITASGTMYDIISYLLKIEQLSYYINFKPPSITAISNVGRAGLSASSASASSGVSIRLNGEIYLLK